MCLRMKLDSNMSSKHLSICGAAETDTERTETVKVTMICGKALVQLVYIVPPEARSADDYVRWLCSEVEGPTLFGWWQSPMQAESTHTLAQHNSQMPAKSTLLGSGATSTAILANTIPHITSLSQATPRVTFLGSGSWSQYGLFHAFFVNFISFYFFLSLFCFFYSLAYLSF